MKIAMLQCNVVTGDVAGNVERIVAAACDAAARGADLCVTPELALCGAGPGSFLRADDFAQGCRAGLDRLAEALRDGPPLLVGAPVASSYDEKLLSNAGVLVHKGQWQPVSRKVYQSSGQDVESRYFDRGVTCGLISVGGWRVGVVLCEDSSTEDGAFWKIQYASGHSPLMELIQRGVDAIVHLSAAPFSIGSQGMAERLLSHVAARHHIHLFSANLAGGYDNRIFSGQSLAFDPTGQLLARGKAFAEDVLVVDTAAPENNDIQPLASCIEEAVWRALTLGVRDFVRKCGGERVIVGLSGGMDSALVCSVAAEALGPENVFGMLMPSPYSSKGSVDDSLALAANLGVKTVTLPIEPLMDCYRQSLAPGLECFPPYEGELTFENIQARIRGSLLAALANRARALILNTGNKSEGGMGYCTLYGDAVGALAVIGDLTKTEVYAVGRWYNASRGQEIIPTAIFDKAPSAELRPGQKDEDSLPPYDQLDPVLEGLLASSALGEKDSHPDGAGELTREVRRRLFTSEFKRRQSPPALFVSRVPFGPGWSVPMAGRYGSPRGG